MNCNRCGGKMIPDNTAVIDAMGCVDCGRLVPRTAASGVRARSRSEERAQINRVLRAARRHNMKRA